MDEICIAFMSENAHEGLAKTLKRGHPEILLQ